MAVRFVRRAATPGEMAAVLLRAGVRRRNSRPGDPAESSGRPTRSLCRRPVADVVGRRGGRFLCCSGPPPSPSGGPSSDFHAGMAPCAGAGRLQRSPTVRQPGAGAFRTRGGAVTPPTRGDGVRVVRDPSGLMSVGVPKSRSARPPLSAVGGACRGPAGGARGGLGRFAKGQVSGHVRTISAVRWGSG